VYAAHLAQGDLFPIWSAEDYFGLGTPMPFFYHKLFYYPAALLLLAFGSVRGATIGALLLFLVLGCAGLYRTARRLGLSGRGAALLAACLPFQGYTIFDWLVRGAMAELAACMLAPWLLYSVALLVQEKRAPWHLFTNLLLLALAHAVLAWFALLLVAIAVVAGANGLDARAGRTEAARALGWTALLGLPFLPFLLVYLRLAEHYDVGIVASTYFTPTRQFVDLFGGYLSPARWKWDDDWEAVRTQLNPETLIFLAAAAVGITRHAVRLGWRRFSEDRLLLVLIASCFVYGFLQLRASAFVYALVPGFEFIQFPWRLLGLLQLIVLLLIGAWFARLEAGSQPRSAGLAAALLLALSVAGNHSFHLLDTRYPWIASESVEAPLRPGEEFGAIGVVGEYLPRVAPRDDTDAARAEPRRVRYKEMHDWLVAPPYSFASPESRRDCRARAWPRARFEPRALVYTVDCPSPGQLIARHHYSGLERVVIEQQGRSWRAAATRTADDPRVRIDVPAGPATVTIELPRLEHLLDAS
jgi:hypothetical protein